MLGKLRTNVDWILFLALLPLMGAGLITMNSFAADNHFFDRQVLWVAVSLAALLGLSFFDLRFLRRTDILVGLFLLGTGLLLLLLGVGNTVKGAKAWFSVGGFSFQPSDPMKLIVILVLAKYFSRRHVEIANVKHIFISGLYAFVPFVLVLLEPDFGSAMVIFFIWFGMIVVSGISKKHLFLVFAAGTVAAALLWSFAFEPYQKARIMTFLNPLTDVRGAGYNAYQSTIAVGSGELTGKGVGYGTQSRLKFLPEYQTDFIFAAFAEEWGFVGVLLIFFLFGAVIWRVLKNALVGATNFEMLYGMGLAIYFMVHFTVNVGMNIGLLPVTGLTIPFMSYGGSHLLTEGIGLGILMGMRKGSRTAHRDLMKNEFLGI
ncbi:MAG: rod shape-determining protein RodA [bacterium]|nr:rod shape-determining protein RodA [bacterium]